MACTKGELVLEHNDERQYSIYCMDGRSYTCLAVVYDNTHSKYDAALFVSSKKLLADLVAMVEIADEFPKSMHSVSAAVAQEIVDKLKVKAASARQVIFQAKGGER